MLNLKHIIPTATKNVNVYLYYIICTKQQKGTAIPCSAWLSLLRPVGFDFDPPHAA